MYKKLFVFGVACCLAGCDADQKSAAYSADNRPTAATRQYSQVKVNRPVNRRVAYNRYKGLSLASFIRSRFTGFYQYPTKGNNLASNNPRKQMLNDYYNIGKPMSDGSYINFAPYSAQNIQYIERPKKELARYCQANGGSFRSVAYFSKDIVADAYISPIKSYLGAKASLSRIDYSVDGRGKIKLSKQAVETLARDQYMQAEKINRMHDIRGSISGYMAAVQAGSFGRFACISRRTNNPQWNVSIIPIMYKPSHSDSFAQEALYIGINPRG